jgi:hypothetical protein
MRARNGGCGSGSSLTGYYVLFNTNGVKILDDKQKIIMKGPRDHATGLWRINLSQQNPICTIFQPPSQHHSVNNVYALRNSGALVNYLHKDMFSCTTYALIHAIKKGQLATWPGLTVEAVNKHLKLTPATDMGHMSQRRHNTRSTKPKLIAQDDEYITPLGSEEKTHSVFAMVLDHGQVYTDLTASFPTRSSKGKNGLMICYSYNANYIRPITMKSKSGAEWVRSFGVVFDEMTAKGFKPKLQTMDNEASAALNNYFTEKEMSYQLVPPHCRCTNAAERALRTFTEHFKAGLATDNPYFPARLWYRLLPQAEITLNLLRSSRLHPQLSAAAHYNGLIDYNKTAFAPPCCKIIAHEKPSQRRTWAPHGQPVWSPGPAMDHYRCQNVYITATESERIVDTLDVLPYNSPMPQMSSTDRILMAAQDMTDSLKHPHPDFPLATIGDDTIAALDKLSEVFTKKFKKQEPPDPAH